MWIGICVEELRLREAAIETLVLLGHHSILRGEGTVMLIASSLALLPPSQGLSKNNEERGSTALTAHL